MCGILFSAGLEHQDVLVQNAAVVDLLNRRGPDSQLGKGFDNLRSLPRHGPLAPRVPLSFYSSVLSLRGEEVVRQPLEDPNTGAVLCWNGEAWQIDDQRVVGNDTVLVQRGLLEAALKNANDKTESSVRQDYVVRFIASVSGPFAIVFYDPVLGRVYFARDCLGRRSLLVKHDAQCFTLSSVSAGQNIWSEIDADGIYVLHLKGDRLANDAAQRFPDQLNFLETSGTRIALFPWSSYGKIPSFNHSLPPLKTEPLTSFAKPVTSLEKQLLNSISLRLGVEDSSLLSNHRAIHMDAKKEHVEMARVPEASSRQIPSRFAILFSGGLDCSVLARLINDLLPLGDPVDLLNVAFQNPRQQELQNGSMESVYELCPDRITARKAHSELNRVCPARKWRLVEIDIPFEEAQAHRDLVLSLMYPHDTEMDRSIALALYFAARGRGRAACTPGAEKEFYESPARVLFSGLGADELFGGYQRHATAFLHNGFPGLLDALELDISRLGKRNLGRDDRIISHWGKETRYPYLDESLVAWAIQAPVWDKCGFGEDRTANAEHLNTSIEPGKKVLRLVAWRLGMPGVACEKKRAIQFGARTAKMEGKSKGTQTVARTRIADD